MIRIYEDLEIARRTVLRTYKAGGHSSSDEEYPQSVLDSIERVFGAALSPRDAVARLLDEVRANGDAAIRAWTQRIDGIALGALEVPSQALNVAYDALDTDLRDALELAAGRIRDFHQRQPIPTWTTDEMGGTLGQRVVPLRRVGIYVPAGTAPLPSSLLMATIPARVAGVDEIIVCSPTTAGAPTSSGCSVRSHSTSSDTTTAADGMVNDVILAAAKIAGVDRVYCIGGALAIAAMAYGTDSVPAVDKIVGAGGLFTTLAKRQVYGTVGLDGLFGPTETLVIADDSADPAWVAADLLAQAEHDVLATALLLTPSRALAETVQKEVERQLHGQGDDDSTAPLNRGTIIAQALAEQGGIVLTPDLETAVRLADEFAPEHLCLSVRDPERWSPHLRSAGGIFLGERSCEVLGDYVAGPSHIMPTGGTARFASPVNVLDFVKIVSIIALDAATATRLAGPAARIARAESLTAHAAAAAARCMHEDEKSGDPSTTLRMTQPCHSQRSEESSSFDYAQDMPSATLRMTQPCHSEDAQGGDK
jgi:histidinol dehydrogenase